MDVVVKGRHCEISDSFREHAEEKLGRLEKHDHRIIRLEVELCTEHNPRLASVKDRVETKICRENRSSAAPASF